MKMFLLGMLAMYFLFNVVLKMSFVILEDDLRKIMKQDKKKIFKSMIKTLFFGGILVVKESSNYF